MDNKTVKLLDKRTAKKTAKQITRGLKREVHLKFDYMEMDSRVAQVILYNDGKVTCELFTDDIMDNPLSMGVTLEGLGDFLKSRCFPETRGNAKQLLEYLGLTEYSVLAIVMKTRGVQNDDFYWIRVEGDMTKWEDIRIR